MKRRARDRGSRVIVASSRDFCCLTYVTGDGVLLDVDSYTDAVVVVHTEMTMMSRHEEKRRHENRDKMKNVQEPTNLRCAAGNRRTLLAE